MANSIPKSIPAIKVSQWLDTWDESIDWAPDDHRREPEHCFYLLSIPAVYLRALSGVERRSVENRMEIGKDTGIQRGLNQDRSEEIARFIGHGYPWSALSKAKRESEEFDDLKMPGWLPTALVINVKQEDDVRPSGQVAPSDLASLGCDDEGSCSLKLPKSFTDLPWDPEKDGSHPIEIIDGQHRLWAFDEDDVDDSYEFPVVAFSGLDISWQAYLFYVINIKPKRISASMAYDLYPLLRDQTWLERGESHKIYQEARAQELTEALWSYPRSPWCNRISMLGDTSGGQVKQASWVRNLVATMVRKRSGPGIKIGGLFGASGLGESEWNRIDQAAILIFIWQCIVSAVEESEDEWAESLRALDGEAEKDSAFYGKMSLLNTDQGVRGVLHVVNDMLVLSRRETGLNRWQTNLPNESPNSEVLEFAIDQLISASEVSMFIEELATVLASFDWRTAKAPGLQEAERIRKLTYRGSGGYKQIRTDILVHLSEAAGVIGTYATNVRLVLQGEGNE